MTRIKSNSTILSSLKIIIFLFSLLVYSLSWSATVSFSQLDFDLEGTIIDNSEWGEVKLTYVGEDPILYFNLVVNGSWQIQNIPVLSREGVGVTQTDIFNFDLGVPRNQDITSLNYAFTLSPTIQTGIPTGLNTAGVGNETAISYRAVGEGAPILPTAGSLIGGTAVDSTKRSISGFPNQECGVNKCAPVSASNSLQYLNTKGKLNIPDADISSASMDGTMTNHPSGGKFRETWWEEKRAYLEQKKIDIKTSKTTSLAEVAKAIANGYDVELQGDWHTAAIVGITDLGNGKFSVDVAHDTKQGVAGGAKVQTMIYNPATAKFEGSPSFFDGSSFRYAVIERIPEPNAISLFMIGAIALFIPYKSRSKR